MKWGAGKNLSSSSSSWFSKFKWASVTSEPKSRSEENLLKQNLGPVKGFNGGEDGEKRRGVLKTVPYYDTDDDDGFDVSPQLRIEGDSALAGFRSEEIHELSAEKQRNTVCISRGLQMKVQVCKIKALEDLKRAKLRMKMASLESFAVVKSSFDPQKDFRDSMVEMIFQKRICRVEELEELLACYLALNSDEYHDLIIKVFKHVCFAFNLACFGPEITERKLSVG